MASTISMRESTKESISQPESRSSKITNSIPDTISLLELVIFFQFVIAFAIFILATVGVAVGYEVSTFYVLSLLEVVIAAPGVAHIALKSSIYLAVYVSFQVITAISEIFWIVYIIASNGGTLKWLSLSILLFVQTIAIFFAFVSRDTAIQFTDKLVPRIVKTHQNTSLTKSKDIPQKKPYLRDPSSLSAETTTPRHNDRSESEKSVDYSPKPKPKRKLRKKSKKEGNTPRKPKSISSSTSETPKLTAPLDSLCD
ncbi:unnamed protein product [Caenorhabditis angaria]|uniref:Uncharacterized protein n=1 Tax=Caenorhabditis angaria TaxID=860376 RepID=A0A9P1IZ05_9PELO|nr:unnamed protein product [Caenorhabditis angaria]